ncbi:MAG TPA: response regulator [Crinalium sp.]|jgi:DNA-binding response OmpR family regulator
MKRILIIEDDLAIGSLIQELLEMEGFHVTLTESGKTGVQLAQQHWPDLIICDVMLPDLDGYGVLSALREHDVFTTVPFVFLTARANKADLREGMRLGADDYLTKPFAPQELLDAIATRLAKHDAAQRFYTHTPSTDSTE